MSLHLDFFQGVRCWVKWIYSGGIFIAWVLFGSAVTWLSPEDVLLSRVIIVLGIPSICLLFAFWTQKGLNVSNKLVSSVFFIYACHGIFVGDLSKLFLVVSDKSDIQLVAFTILSCSITVGICILLCSILKFLLSGYKVLFGIK